ncbi:MAG: hypothetical protein ACLGG7_01965 [Bacteriovoracia bacterium]
MVTRLVLLFLPLLISAQGRIEEQRKYVPTNEIELPVRPFDVAGLSFVPHETYRALDIYFHDTRGSLVGSGLGLRLRKVVKGERPAEYVLQIKSEMSAPGAARMEEEERNLGIQSIEGVRLVDILDRIDRDKKISALDERLLVSWAERKEFSSLAPFQELRRRGIRSKNLRPAVMGESLRQRYHVVFDRSKTVSPLLLLADSEKDLAKVPTAVKARTDWVWLMEASWDRSRFFRVDGTGPEFRIQELEVENKFRPREVGTKVMNQLELELMQRFDLKPGRESKFLRAYNHLREEP